MSAERISFDRLILSSICFRKPHDKTHLEALGIDFDTFNISLKKQSQAILPWQNKLQILAAKFRLDEAMFFLFHFLFNEINLSLSGKCWRIKDAIQHLTQIYRASLRHLQIKLRLPWVWGLLFLEARFNTEVIFTFVQREVRRCPSTSTVERKPKKTNIILC